MRTRSYGRAIALMLNVNAILWSFAGMAWVLAWDDVFPDREACAEAIVEEVRRTPGVTQIETPQACKGFDQGEHLEIVASIPWASLFPNGPDTGLGRGESPKAEPEPVRPTRKPARSPRPKPSPTAEPTAGPTESPSPKPSESGKSPDVILPPIDPDPPTPIVPSPDSGTGDEADNVGIEPVRAF